MTFAPCTALWAERLLTEWRTSLFLSWPSFAHQVDINLILRFYQIYVSLIFDQMVFQRFLKIWNHFFDFFLYPKGEMLRGCPFCTTTKKAYGITLCNFWNYLQLWSLEVLIFVCIWWGRAGVRMCWWWWQATACVLIIRPRCYQPLPEVASKYKYKYKYKYIYKYEYRYIQIWWWQATICVLIIRPCCYHPLPEVESKYKDQYEYYKSCCSANTENKRKLTRKSTSLWCKLELHWLCCMSTFQGIIVMIRI